jgi:hypothetical protein
MMIFYSDSDGVDFVILSLHNKQWHFEASSVEERDEWVAAIEQQILSSLQVILILAFYNPTTYLLKNALG